MVFSLASSGSALVALGGSSYRLARESMVRNSRSGSFRQNAVRASAVSRHHPRAIMDCRSVIPDHQYLDGASLCWGIVSPSCPYFRVVGRVRQPCCWFAAHRFIEPSSIVPGERAPGRLGGFAPSPRGRSADRRWCGTPHPVARLAVGPVPSAEGNGRPMTRTGAPIGASPRRFPSSSGPPSGNGQGRPFSNALDSTGFPPLSSAPPARCRTDPCSWAGRCLPRPPEARLARPNPQAPHPSPFACAS